jgi:hypothetical protein
VVITASSRVRLSTAEAKPGGEAERPLILLLEGAHAALFHSAASSLWQSVTHSGGSIELWLEATEDFLGFQDLWVSSCIVFVFLRL